MSTFYAEYGILHQVSCIKTSEKNGVVERKHQDLLNVARSLIFQSNIPMPYWSYCILHACYLINITPTPILKTKSPFELLYKTIPTYDHPRVLVVSFFHIYLLNIDLNLILEEEFAVSFVILLAAKVLTS